MTNLASNEELIARLQDLQRQSETYHKQTESYFLNEEEQAVALSIFLPSQHIIYDGGYEGSQKKKVIFRYDEEDDFSDIVCIASDIDNRFQPIGHRDILGALMHLQIDRHHFGDFWVENNKIYIYTSSLMAKFLCQELIKIGRHNVSFKEIDERPVQVFKLEHFEKVISSNRIDAVVASLANISRGKAKEMIKEGKVQINHRLLADVDEVCNNNCTISIRGVGRFIFLEVLRSTKKDRIVVAFAKYI